MHFSYAPARGWVDPEKIKLGEAANIPMKVDPDTWAPFNLEYPSGYILPHSFKHPVTGQTTSEQEHNAKLKLRPNKFLEKNG